MGFLSAYSGTERVDLDGGYWIEIKKCLTAGEMQLAEKKLAARPTVDPSTGRGEAQIDPAAYRNELMFMSITGWNLDEDDGTVWALEPASVKRHNIARLPSSVFDRVWEKVDNANERTSKEETAQFRDEAERGAADGDAGAGEPVHVPAGASPVAAPGAAPGRPGLPPLA